MLLWPVHHRFTQCIVLYPAPRHHLNKCCVILNIIYKSQFINKYAIAIEYIFLQWETIFYNTTFFPLSTLMLRVYLPVATRYRNVASVQLIPSRKIYVSPYIQNVLVSIKISLKLIPTGLINNIPALVQKRACGLVGAKPLFESKLEYC